ncbi:hypothetical protein AC625_21470 [Peribacillus loiseleuriae]|uniref:Uncharacterized protein n=1 Tax=Peribacillus loiseleuriae TaxID=1679170 RepID=A0A0K9GYQ3_9BACI|nr:hypothetical protein AC625_21470 [Peribacillus loiseleuriae]
MPDLQIKRSASFLAVNSHVLGIFLYEGDGASQLTNIANLLSGYTDFIDKASKIPALHRHHCD